MMGHLTERIRLELIYQDIRFALRSLRRSPALSVAIVGTIGLGVGVNAALFTIADRVFFQAPGGVVHPERVRRLFVEEKGIGERRYTSDQFSIADLQILSHAADRSADIEGYAVRTNRTIENGGAGESVGYVTGGFFALAGVRPQRGRFFLTSENEYGAPISVAVLDHEFWQSKFAGDSTILGKQIHIDSASFTIVGIAPPNFGGMDLGRIAVWAPLASLPSGGEGAWWNHPSAVTRLFARLSASANEAELGARLNTRFRSADAARLRFDPALRLEVAPLLQARGDLRYSRQESRNIALLQRLTGVGLLIVLITATNVASLLLMRAVRRRREIAIRLALGVSRARLFLQLFCESCLLAVIGGGLALWIAWVGGGALRHLLFPDTRWSSSIIDYRAVLITALITVIVASTAGLAPLSIAGRRDLMEALKSGGIDSGRERSRLRIGLLMSQTALCTVMVMLAGVFTQSLRRASEVDLGFDADRLITFSFGRSDPNASVEALGRIGSLPGVVSVARSNLDLIGGRVAGISFPNGDSIPGISGPTYSLVDTSYASVLGLRMVRGRWFSVADLGGPTVVINEAMAAEYWGGKGALDQCFYAPTVTHGCLRIIGIVGNVRWDLTEPPLKWMYLPAPQAAAQCCSIVAVRTRDVAEPALTSQIRDVAARISGIDQRRSLSPRLVVERHSPLMQPWRLSGTMFAVFAALALAAAAAGIYGLIAYDVTQRSHEFGVRAALGASRHQLLTLVVFDGIRVVLSGVAAGLLIASAVGQLIASLLFETAPHDPVVLVASTATLVFVACIASFVPAWRAASTNPTVALRG